MSVALVILSVNSVYFKGNIGTSNWGLNLLQEENVIPDIVTLAHNCEVLSIRGYVFLIIGPVCLHIANNGKIKNGIQVRRTN